MSDFDSVLKESFQVVLYLRRRYHTKVRTSKSGKQLPKWAAILIPVVAVIFVIIVAAALIYYFCCADKKKKVGAEEEDKYEKENKDQNGDDQNHGEPHYDPPQINEPYANNVQTISPYENANEPNTGQDNDAVPRP